MAMRSKQWTLINRRLESVALEPRLLLGLEPEAMSGGIYGELSTLHNKTDTIFSPARCPTHKSYSDHEEDRLSEFAANSPSNVSIPRSSGNAHACSSENAHAL